jgi:hypothetical protein
MTNGWIKLHRKLIDWGWYKSPETTHFFIYLLLKATDKEGYFKGVAIQRGDVIIGRKQAAEDTGLSEQTIRTCITRLKSTNEITSKSTNKFSIITLVNYSDYQNIKVKPNQQINQQSNQQLTNNQPTTNHILRSKEDKNKENPLPPFINPDLWKEYIETRKKIKAPMTEHAKKLTIEELEKLKTQGEEPSAVLKQSIEKSYRGVFPVKDKQDFIKQPHFNEDTHFQCRTCKAIKRKSEREGDICRTCAQKEAEKQSAEYRKKWEGMTDEEKVKHLEKLKSVNIQPKEWMIITGAK